MVGLSPILRNSEALKPGIRAPYDDDSHLENMLIFLEQFPSPTRGLGPGGSPQMHAHASFDLHQHPLAHQQPNLQEGLVVPSQSSPSTTLNDLASSSRLSLSPALSPSNFSVSPTQPPFVYGQQFYHPGPYPNNGNVPGYVYYPPNQQQPPQQQ
jgi:hypothetical protein